MFLDDLPVGTRFQTATRTLTEAEIIGFAQSWDPQPFHLSPEGSPYGGLIASGFHSLLTAFVLTLEAQVWTEASLGSPGMDAIRWLKPVRPGDTLQAVGEVVESRASTSKPDRGIATIAYTVTNQTGEVVMTYRIITMLRRQPADSVQNVQNGG